MNREQPPLVDRSTTIDPLKLGRSSKARALTLVQNLSGEPFTPLAPPRRDNSAPTRSTHALAETMGFGPFTTIRLVSALHKTTSRNSLPLLTKARPVYPNREFRPTSHLQIPTDTYAKPLLSSRGKKTRKTTFHPSVNRPPHRE